MTVTITVSIALAIFAGVVLGSMLASLAQLNAERLRTAWHQRWRWYELRALAIGLRNERWPIAMPEGWTFQREQYLRGWVGKWCKGEWILHWHGPRYVQVSRRNWYQPKGNPKTWTDVREAALWADEQAASDVQPAQESA